MPWTKYDKAPIGKGYVIRDASGTYACPICWNINKGYEQPVDRRIRKDDLQCPICKVELEWEPFNE